MIKIECQGFTRSFVEVLGGYALPCNRCGGTGIYTHYHGHCYSCRGLGYRGVIRTLAEAEKFVVTSGKRTARAREAKEAARAEQVAKRDAEHAAALARVPEHIRSFLSETGTTSKSPFIAAMRERLNPWAALIDGEVFTDNMLAAITKIGIAEVKRHGMEPHAEGRMIVAGTVQNVWSMDGQYGTVRRMSVLVPSGHVLSGTIPRALDDRGVSAGSVVEFTATVKVGKTPDRAYYSRPVVKA